MNATKEDLEQFYDILTKMQRVIKEISNFSPTEFKKNIPLVQYTYIISCEERNEYLKNTNIANSKEGWE